MQEETPQKVPLQAEQTGEPAAPRRIPLHPLDQKFVDFLIRHRAKQRLTALGMTLAVPIVSVTIFFVTRDAWLPLFMMGQDALAAVVTLAFALGASTGGALMRAQDKHTAKKEHQATRQDAMRALIERDAREAGLDPLQTTALLDAYDALNKVIVAAEDQRGA